MNLIGKNFNRWLVISYAGNDKGYPMWNCKCICGSVRKVRQQHLISGTSKSCGCLATELRIKRYKNITGNKIGKLTAIKYIRSSGSGAIWLFECECGKTCELTSGEFTAGGFGSCGKCRRVSWKGYGEISSWYWNSLRRNAKTRGLHFEITIEEVWNLFLSQEKKCALTGLPISFPKIGTWKNKQSASLDRIDSKNGYVTGNIQWLHKDCNFAKGSLSAERFDEICILRAKYITQLKNKISN